MSALAVAAVALALPGGGLRLLALVGRVRPADIVRFLELALLVAPHIPFVGAGIDQFTFAAHGWLLWLTVGPLNRQESLMFPRRGRSSLGSRRKRQPLRWRGWPVATPPLKRATHG